ncbi:MAG: FAD:protein FMN transferase, partial [Bacteroidales bacterium]|nr:FAD:protein FMN transferase [Bacteroidales bacterium]
MAVILSGIFVLTAACTQTNSKGVDTQYIITQGFAQGTTWHITYRSIAGEDLTPQFDSILRDFDNSISTYNKQSLLTKINHNEDVAVDSIIAYVFRQSQRMYAISGGMFDPTCRPLVNAWGFGKHTDLKVPSKAEIDSILQFVGMDKVNLDGNRIVKNDPRITLNFNANA